MKLYYTPGACSLSPLIVLEELGLPFECEAVDLATKRTASGTDFTLVNPNGYVPALVLDGGEVLTEGPAIVQYLADLKPDSRLAPANGTLARYQLQSWLNLIATELHKSCSPFFNPSASDDWKAGGKANLQRRLAHIESVLGDRDYLLGEDFTVADAYLFTVLSWMGFIRLDLSSLPRLQAYQARIGARPAVQAALQKGGLG